MSTCPSCRGVGGRTVSELLDGEHIEIRYEECTHCDDYAAELAEDERLDELLEREGVMA